MKIDKRIIDQIFKGMSPSDNLPFYALACGGPASHKCLFGSWLQKNKWADFVSIDEHIATYLSNMKPSPFPHEEKSPDNIESYYEAVDFLVAEAVRRGVSIVLEDHGDFPDIYKGHVSALNAFGYECFAIGTTISPAHFDAKIKHLMKKDNLPDFRKWGRAYHKRFSQRFDDVLLAVGRGILVETQPEFSSVNNTINTQCVLLYEARDKKQITEIFDLTKYSQLSGWKWQLVRDDTIEKYFHAADVAMKYKKFNIPSDPIEKQIINREHAHKSAFDSFIKDIMARNPRPKPDRFLHSYVYELNL